LESHAYSMSWSCAGFMAAMRRSLGPTAAGSGTFVGVAGPQQQ
jgi:hypothetical protein